MTTMFNPLRLLTYTLTRPTAPPVEPEPAPEPAPAPELCPPADTRPTRQICVDLLATVDFGEWTTYAELSEAVFGHRRCGGLVAKLLAQADAPDQHRIVSLDNKPSSPDQMWKIKKLRSEGVRILHGWLVERSHVGVIEMLRRDDLACTPTS